MSIKLKEQLNNVSLRTTLPNHNECFHTDFVGFLSCPFSTIYEVRLLSVLVIEEVEREVTTK